VADNIGAFVRGEEDLAGGAQPHDVAVLGLPDAVIAELVQALLETVHGYEGLRLEGGGTLDGSAAFCNKHRQQEDLNMRRKLILPALAGDLNRKSKAFALQDTVENGPGDFLLLRS